MTIKEVIDKFLSLNIIEFEIWCKNNNLITYDEDFPTQRRFGICLSTDDEQEVEYVVTVRPHVKSIVGYIKNSIGTC